MRSRSSITAILVAASVLVAGCAGDYVARTGGVRRAYERHDHEKALALLEEGDARARRRLDEGRHPDALLYLLDRGMILHVAGRHEESNAVLHEAERLAESLDIVSIGEEARTLTANERLRAYRGEDFERLLINVVKALNFKALGDEEAALVEVRRANERLRVMVSEERRPYRQLAIARYVAGLLWESAGELDSAFIDYMAAHETVGGMGHLAEPLLRIAKASGRIEAYEALLRRHPDVEHAPLRPDEGQVVVIVEAGLSPEKRAAVHEDEIDWLALPHYQPRSWNRQRARIRAGEIERMAVTLTSVESVAVHHLTDRIGRMLARSVAGTAVRAGVATAVGSATKSEELGVLTFYLLMLNNRPDLRAWLSLPAEFQVARFRLPAGEHTVEVVWSGERTEHPVVVRPGEIEVLTLRRF
jgi:uncharacterized protein